MRILFTFAGGSGHLEPLVPLARAAADTGHVVALVGRPWMAPKVEELGLVAFSAGSDAGLAPVTRPLLEVDMDRERRDVRDGFARRIARQRAADLVPLFERWRPDLVVWEETDLGAPIVAERLGLPHVSVIVIASGDFATADLLAPALDELRSEYGLPADPTCQMLRRHLVLSPVPPRFRDPADPLPPTTHLYRMLESRPPVATRPAWASTIPAAPAVYLTLGTVFNHESGDLFERVIAGLRELPVNALVTVGREIDPVRFGPQPPRITIERFVPQADVLPYADLVVTHGGSGSVLGALGHGLPMVLLPMGADQPLNAARCETLGVGLVLDAVRATASDVRDAVSAVLAEPSFREHARPFRDEIAALPRPEAVVPLLERLVSWS